MTKFKAVVQDFESVTTVSKTIRIYEDNNREAMIVTLLSANVREYKDLSSKIESAIRRALK